MQGRPTVFVWDAPKRFPVRRIIATGPYASKFGYGQYRTETLTVGAVMEQMRLFGRELLKGADQATISGQIELMHTDYDVPLGGIVERLSGRDLYLWATHVNEEPIRYPQIVAIHHEIQDNEATLTLTAEPENLLEAFA